MSFNAIAQAHFLVTEKGVSDTMTIALAQPVMTPTNTGEQESWYCVISLKCLNRDDQFSIFGMSSLHALSLALRFTATYLNNLQKKGIVEIFYTDGTPCDIDELKNYLCPP